jgi:hypothetical protein
MSGTEDVAEPRAWSSVSAVVLFHSGVWLFLFTLAIWPPAARGAQSADSASRPAAVSASNLSIKPAAVTVAMGEPQRLRLVDASGKEIRNGTWTVSDPAVVEISNHGDVLATGLKPGRVRVVASSNGQSAEARITVLGDDMGAPKAAPNPAPVEAGTANRVTNPGEVSPIYLTPDTLGMVVGNTHTLILIGEDGHPIRGATWSVDNPMTAKVTPGDEALVEALATGDFTVTASWNGYEAEAKATVYPGNEIPQGKARWSVHARPGYKETDMKPAVPSASGVDLLELEQDKCGRYLTRGLDSEGHQVWIVFSDPAHHDASASENCTGTPAPAQLIPTFR